MRVLIRLVGIFAMLFSTPALAGAQDFVRCDGFGPPSEHGFDGMNLINWANGHDLNGRSTGRTLLHMNGVSTAQQLPPPGRAGEFLCGVVLSDPLLTDQFWVRRTHLLQAMAVHQIAAGHAEAALVTLDKADALGAAHADAWFRESLRIGDAAVRAAALQRLGQLAEARVAAESLRSARPFAPSVALLARRLLALIDPDPGAGKARMIADAPLAPSLLEDLFWRAIDDHEFARAVELSHTIAFATLAVRGGWVIESKGSYYANLNKRMQAITGTAEAAQRWIDSGGSTAAPSGLTAPADQLDLAELMRLLPLPEAAVLVPAFIPEGKKSNNGYSVLEPDETGRIKVSFGSLRGTPAMVEEAALLAAALEARRQGKDSLLIDAWETHGRSTSGSMELSVSGYSIGTETDTWSSGYEARMAVRMVSAATLQPEFENSRWRLVSVDKVIAALQPRYPPERGS